VVQEVRWKRGGTEPAGEYTFLYGNENENHESGTGLFCTYDNHTIISAVQRVEIASDRISYITLRGRWCDIVLNVHVPTEDKIDDMKDSSYEELESVFDKFPKYNMNILLGDFNAIVGWEGIFTPTIGNETLKEISNENGVRIVNFATSKNLIVKNVQCPHNVTYINLLGHLLMERLTIKLIIF
jgi:hypothetical protein